MEVNLSLIEKVTQFLVFLSGKYKNNCFSVLNTEESESLARSHSMIKHAAYSLTSATLIFITAFYYTNVFLSNKYTINLGSFIFWVFMCPQVLFYLLYGKNVLV